MTDTVKIKTADLTGANTMTDTATQHPCNAARAKRIKLLYPAYADHHDDRGVLLGHHGFVADVLADLRHYCDAHGLDFADRDRVGRTHYVVELGDPDFDGTTKPEDLLPPSA